MRQVVQMMGHRKRKPGVNASGGPNDGTPSAKTWGKCVRWSRRWDTKCEKHGKHIKPKLAEQVSVPLRPLEGRSGCSASFGLDGLVGMGRGRGREFG